MASNRATEGNAYVKSVAVTNPTTPASNDPVRFGSMTGVAVTAKAASGNAATKTSVDFGPGDWNLSVKGVDDNGNSAVAVGDSLFYVDADTPKLSKKSSGYFFGVANAIVTTGSTATISVFHIPSPGSGTLGAGTVGVSNLASGAVSAVKLSATLATGFINLPIDGALIIGSNDIATTAHVAHTTDPILERSSTSTDKSLRLSWASASVLEIQMPNFSYPPDLDDTANVTVNVLAAMKAASVDVPVIAVGAFEGVGGTNIGGNTAALSTTLAQLTVTLTAANIHAYPNNLAITLKPGTHATSSNDVYVYGVWIEYTRK